MIKSILLPICTAVMFLSSYAQEPFIIVVKTDNPGSCSTCFHIPVDDSGQLNYNYSVDWENDGSYDDLSVKGIISHEYDAPGTYEIAITGDFPSIQFDRDTMVTGKLIEVRQWGDIEWESMAHAFSGCDSLRRVSAIEAPDLSRLTNTERMFAGCSIFSSNLNHWNVSSVENMSGMFAQARLFNGNISDWDVSNVRNMTSLFDGATGFRGNINSWDVSRVESMFNTFSRTANDWKLSNWDVSSVTDMRGTFIRNDSLIGDISNWDVSNVTNMEFMFRNCSRFNCELGDWDVSKVKNFGVMFEGCNNFESDLSRWNVSSATNMSSMFMSCKKFTSDLSNWDVSGVTSFTNLFFSCENFESDLSRWDVSNVRSMNSTFRRAFKFNSDLSDWDVSKVTVTRAMFLFTSSFNGDVSTWDMSNVTDAEGMFEYATAFNGDVSQWDVSNISNLIEMFNSASSFNQDIGMWEMSSVQDSVGKMLERSGLSIENYEATLSGWANNPNTPDSVIMESGLLQYCDETGRDLLLSRGWRISGDEKADDIDCLPSAVSELASDEISIYPNPVSEQLHVINSSSELKICTIFSSLGQKMNTISMNTGENMLDTTLLDQGSYYILLDNGGILKFHKL